MQDADEARMRVALAQARVAAQKGEVPVGALLVHEDEIVAQDHNRIVQNNDPTAHAELLVIQQATQKLNRRWLFDCTLYVTLEPCAMCAGAMVLARLPRLVFGALDAKTGACGSLRNVVSDPRMNQRIDVLSGVLGDACGDLLKQFFATVRQRKKRHKSI
ncbi:MAG: tRNA adenosine(34) deaminase TadA [Candidatus Latescibacterota bacterium]